MNTCRDCANWLPCPTPHKVNARGDYDDHGEAAGECHANPPTPHPAKGGAFRVWPVTRESDRCASGWAAKPAKAKPVDKSVTIKEKSST